MFQVWTFDLQAPTATTTSWFRRPPSWFKQLQDFHGTGVWFEAELATVMLEAQDLQHGDGDSYVVWIDSGCTTGGLRLEAGSTVTNSLDMLASASSAKCNSRSLLALSPQRLTPPEVTERPCFTTSSQSDKISSILFTKRKDHDDSMYEPSTLSVSTKSWLSVGHNASQIQQNWQDGCFQVDVTLMNLDVSPYSVISLDYLHLVPTRTYSLGR
jgi:hypothetical protein